MHQWWLDELPSELDQGNVFETLPFTSHTVPPRPLISTALRGGKRGWAEADSPKKDGNGACHFLHHGPFKHGMLLNHGCDVDKPHTKRLIVIPVFPLNEAPKEQRAHIQNQSVVALFYLPDVPALGDCFADFRIMQSVPKAALESTTRISAMSDAAKNMLGARLMAFFLRVDLTEESIGTGATANA